MESSPTIEYATYRLAQISSNTANDIWTHCTRWSPLLGAHLQRGGSALGIVSATLGSIDLDAEYSTRVLYTHPVHPSLTNCVFPTAKTCFFFCTGGRTCALALRDERHVERSALVTVAVQHHVSVPLRIKPLALQPSLAQLTIDSIMIAIELN